VIVGSDLLKTDLLGYKVMLEMKKVHQCVANFTENPFEMKQFQYAKEVFR